MNTSLKEAIKEAVRIHQEARVRQQLTFTLPFPQQLNVQKYTDPDGKISWAACFFTNSASFQREGVKFYEHQEAENIFKDFLEGNPNMKNWVEGIEKFWQDAWTNHEEEKIYWIELNKPGR